MKFLFDNNLSPALARAVDAIIERGPGGYRAFALRDRFPPNAKDPDWIPALGREGGWVVVTADTAMRRVPEERRALTEARLTVIALHGKWLSFDHWEIASRLFRYFPRLINEVEAVEPGTWIDVTVNGKIRRLA